MTPRAVGEAESGSKAEPRIRRLADNEALARATTRHMVGNLEWSGVVFQAATLLVSGVYDPYTDHLNAVVLGLAATHLLIVPLYLRGFGPLTLGGWWVLVYPVQAIAVNALLAAMSEPNTYGSQITCVPGCNYSASMWLFFAYYPWLASPFTRWRTVVELLLLGIYFAFFLLLAYANNGGLSLLNVQSVAFSVMWLALAYILGIAVRKMCFAAAEKQLEVQQQNFAEFFDFLHSHVKSGIAAAKLDIADPRRAREKLDELEDAIGSYRVELLLAQEQVPLAALLSERIRTFTGVVNIGDTPRVGALTVERPTGVLVGRALGDLLKNAAKYGATSVNIRCKVSDASITLEIEDDGPGFPAEYLDDETRSVHRLRVAARHLGGDLGVRPRLPGPGVVLTLSAPLHTRKASPR